MSIIEKNLFDNYRTEMYCCLEGWQVTSSGQAKPHSPDNGVWATVGFLTHMPEFAGKKGSSMDPTWVSNGAQIVMMIIQLFLAMRPHDKPDKVEAVLELRRVFCLFIAMQQHNTELIDQMSWRILEQSRAMRANTEAIRELTRVLKSFLDAPGDDLTDI